MTTMPTPVDLRIWLLSKVLGWPGRRIANEVGVSQPTVVRTLARLEEEPPTGDDMQGYVAAAPTPPRGLPVLKAKTKNSSMLTLALTGAVIIIAVAIAFVLIAIAVSILSR